MRTFHRRQLLQVGAAIGPVFAASPLIAQESTRLLLVHGRAQGGRSEAELRTEWTNALRVGAEAAGHLFPDDTEIDLPFYGDLLDEIVDEFELPIDENVVMRGDETQDAFVAFLEDAALQISDAAGVTPKQIDEAYDSDVGVRGPENWEWVQSILKAIDGAVPAVTEGFLELFLRDVFLYLEFPGVRRAIDDLVKSKITNGRTIIVAHSLGTVVMFNILRSTPNLDIPLFFTIGSPLGINAVRRKFQPLRQPDGVSQWINAFDERDVVALNALDSRNFPVEPAIRNIGDVANQTNNRHGIIGYLDKASIAGPIMGTL